MQASPNVWGQFKVLLKKNFLVKVRPQPAFYQQQARNRGPTVMEALFPLYFMAILAVLKLSGVADPVTHAQGYVHSKAKLTI